MAQVTKYNQEEFEDISDDETEDKIGDLEKGNMYILFIFDDSLNNDSLYSGKRVELDDSQHRDAKAVARTIGTSIEHGKYVLGRFDDFRGCHGRSSLRYRRR